MILLLLVFVAGIVIGSRFQPWIAIRQKTLYVDYSSQRGVRNTKKIFSW